LPVLSRSAWRSTQCLSGLLFLTAAAFFLRDFFRTGDRESYLFLCLFLLFGASNLEFSVSVLWSAAWWFWHAQRLVAFNGVPSSSTITPSSEKASR
jgi:hypothetical protein